MFTRCPQCKKAHPLGAAVLSQARGLVQCGDCGRTFSALSFLYDKWPSGQAHGPATGAAAAPPVLNHGLSPTETQPPTAQKDKPEKPEKNRRNLAWGSATTVLALITVINLLWTFREPLMAMPTISAWLNKTTQAPLEKHGLLKDPEQIQLVSRDMHSHPTRSGILVLSLTFVNLAQHSQVFPELEVTLLDAANQAVARRLLQPTDYLRPDAEIDAGLATDVYLPVLLELGDPGDQAVGFEIQFL